MTPRQEEIRAAYHEHGSVKATARALGLSPKAVRESLKRSAAHIDLGDANPPPGFEPVAVSTDGKGAIRSVRSQRRPAAESFLPTEPVGHLVDKVTTTLRGDGTVQQQHIKTRVEKEAQWRAFWEACQAEAEALRGAAGVLPPVLPEVERAEDQCAVYVLGDPHVGMLAWEQETGRSHDLKACVDLHKRAIALLARRTQPTREAYLINVGDFFHANDQSNTTPRSGHQLDVDSRHGKVARAGIRLIVDMVRLLRSRHDTVHVVNCKGNHDPEMAVMLAVALEMFFYNDPFVIVHPADAPLQVYRFGLNIIAATHGDGIPLKKQHEVLPLYAKDHWSEAEYCHVISGHVHHEQVIERGGVVCETFNTLTPADYYAASHGYLSHQSVQSLVFHAAGGIVSRSKVRVNRKGELV